MKMRILILSLIAVHIYESKSSTSSTRTPFKDRKIGIGSVSTFGAEATGGVCQKSRTQNWIKRKSLTLRGGSDPELGMKTLFQAIQDGNLKQIEKSAAEGIDLNRFCSFVDPHLEPNALHYAAFHDNPKVIGKLVELGANVNLQNNRGYTALHYAAVMGKFEVCKALVLSGADLNLTDMYMDQPIDRAEQAQCTEIVKWMAAEMAARGIERLWRGYGAPELELHELIEDASKFNKNHSFIPRFMRGKNGELLPEYSEAKDQEIDIASS